MSGLVDQLAQSTPPAHVGIYLSGLDLEREVADYRAALAGYPWAGSITVENDLFALLRAGTSAPDAAAVICGTGLNALAIRADGEVARFLALGPISGDWGGGAGIGELALWFAAREEDGRGEHTSLTAALPHEFDLRTVGELTEALHSGRLAMPELARLSPRIQRVYLFHWNGRNSTWDSALISPNGSARPAFAVLANELRRLRR